MESLSNAELIDRLQMESDETLGISSTVWAAGFLPIYEEPEIHGGILGSAPPHKSPTLTELVRRGVSALPSLIDHLSDARTTKLTVGNGFIGRWFLDEYDPRYRASSKQAVGVNTVGAGSEIPASRRFKRYTLKVADFCYVAIGQIVNRDLDAVRYQPTLCLVVNSPSQVPALAEAIKQDWSGLTPEEHEASLYQDTLRLDAPFVTQSAITRLLYYYPTMGLPLTKRLLARPLVDTHLVIEFIGKVLIPADQSQWTGLLNGFRQVHGAAIYQGLLLVLMRASTMPNSQMDPERQRWKQVSDQILTRSFPGTDPLNPPFVNAVGYDDQARLISALHSMQLQRIDNAILDVYQRAVNRTPSELRERMERDNLALACAEFVAGKRKDMLMRSFFAHEVYVLREHVSAQQRVKDKSRPGDADDMPGLLQLIDRCSAVVRRLSY